jgi:hypothetical protein
MEGFCEYVNGRNFITGEEFNDSESGTNSYVSVLSIVEIELRYV